MERPRDGAGAQIELRQPPLVGRQRELARLRAALAQARAGDGRAVFLAGEAGAGKTRLAQTAAKAARVDGFQVLDGRAYSLEGGLAYAPILGAFGPLLRRLPPGRRERLTDGLPDLGRLFSHLRLPPPPSLGNPALEKTRLFDAIARLLERLAAEQPLLVLLDDLHWADPASIELLHYLSRDLGSLPVLLLGSYRPEEIDAARGLRALLTSLRRVGLAEELALARLPPHEIAALARGVLGGEPPPELLELLNTQAGGTPLYAEAMIGALADAGLLTRSDGRWTLDRPPELVLPTVVRDLLLERLSRLGEAERGLLDLLAAGGEAVRHPVLRAVSRLDEETLLARLGHLRALGLVAEETLGDEVVYTTGHPLIQHVAYGDLAEIARRRAHAAYAVALERLHPAELDRLAHHYRLAGPEVERGRALEVLLAAGRLADEQYANDQAARHYGAALALARQDSIAGPELLTLLLERLGRAWERVGEGAAAVAIWREAIEGYEQAGERVAAARLYRLTALAEWDRGQFDAALADFEAGLRALGEDGPAPELAELLHAQLIVLNRLGEYERSLALARRLRALAAELGSARVLAGAYLAEAHPLMSRWRVAEALAATERGLAAAEQAGEPLLLQRGHDQMSLLLYDLGEHQRSRRHAEQSLAIGRRLRAPMLAIFPRNRLVSLDLMAGDWERARRESAAVLALAHRLEAGRAIAGALGFRSLTCLLSGDVDEARAGIARARAAFAHGGRLDRNIFSPLVLVEMLAALEEGHAEGALAALARLEGQPATGGVQFRTEAVAGEAFVAAGDAERGLSIAAALRRHAAPETPTPTPTPFVLGLSERLTGLARRALGCREEALAALTAAAERFDEAAVPFEAARARYEWAVTAREGDPSGAIATAQTSLLVFEQLRAPHYAARARRLLYQLGARPRGLPRPSSGGVLSPRELEVVRLVAEDLTNAEIAERLAISPRTVTTHLNHVYARLGISTRTALVRYAVEQGLLDADGR